MGRRDAIASVAADLGVSKHAVYDALIASKTKGR